MDNNFEFLNKRWPILANLGKLSEKNLYIDSNTAFIKMGMFGELIVTYMMALENIDETSMKYENTHANRIKLLKREDLLPKEIDDILFSLRKKRNVAAHVAYESVEEAKVLLGLTYKLGVWFMQTYGDWDFEPQPFVLPKEDANTSDIEEISKQYDGKVKFLEEELKKLRESQSTEDINKRRKQAIRAVRNIAFTEEETRQIIDVQLRNAGWEADSIALRFSKGAIPEKGKNKAIAEWPTSSIEKKRGKVDYALFIGTQLVGFIEAKKSTKDVIGNMIESKIYAKGVKEEHEEYIANSWGEYKVPFLFVCNGREYIKELEDRSGVHFLDCRKSTNHPKALQGWYSPEKLQSMLEENIEEANEHLNFLSYDILKDPDGVGLRDYQVEAIKAAENVIIEGRSSALLTMATGTGKTRTVLGLIYRLLVTKRFKRILFLVDRTALGDQAQEAFDQVKIENLMPLGKIYNINGLEDKLIDKETKIHVATVQAMVKRILYSEENVPSVGDYDCIIIDEAHRGYILDKEMSDDEIDWRDNRDFISKYKKVIEYFDAFKIALTATPALHTTEIFGQPVYTYSYRDAVIDGYLVDHEPPHIIKTELMEQGIHYKRGEKVPKYNTVTGELLNGAELEDDIDFEIDQFNKKVISESYNKKVLEEVAKYISPEDKGKTLIFAANDAHADTIVRMLKEIYDELQGGVDDDAIVKITGSIKDPDLAIKKFKNETYPSIVVTVDLLTTGIDVPKVDKLVFMRRVKSRMLYEQMLGRATRLCSEIDKTHFEIFDCVNLYEALSLVTNMKPVVVDAKESFKILSERLKRASSEEEKKNEIDKIIAKLQRKKKLIKDDEKTVFKSFCNDKSPQEFIEELKNSKVDEALDKIVKNNALIEYLDQKSYNEQVIIVSDKEDKLISHERGYGKGKRPKDYLNEFKKYIEENQNRITALNIVCTRPKDLTRDDLKGLRAILDKEGFNEEYLKTAWRDLSNEEIAADIISFIRQQALGSALIPVEERVKKAVGKIKREYYLTPVQTKWLEKIENAMLKEVIIDKKVFDVGNFKREGGFNRYDKIFDNKLEEIIDKIKEYMFNETA